MPVTTFAVEGATGLLQRVLKAPAATLEVGGLSSILEGWTWLFVDTGTIGWMTSAIADMGVHILHAEDESAAWVEVGGERIAVHPGDSVLAYRGDIVLLAPGMLVVVFVGSRDGPREESRATHGEESFVGHNRRTTYDAVAHMAFDRWKLTQPITFVAEEPCPLICIFGSVTVTVGNRIMLLRPGQALAFIGQADILPDGLAYAMTIRDPDRGNGVYAEAWDGEGD
jgi:hypothetical protein